MNHPTQRKEDGIAYVMLLPFIIHASKREGRTQFVQVDGFQVGIYWPFVNGGSDYPDSPTVDWLSVPVPPGTGRFERSPATMQFSTRLKWNFPDFYPDAIRVDFFPPAFNEVRPLVNRLYGVFRWWTLQWWIGRDQRHAKPATAAGIGIDRLGRPVGSVWGSAQQIGLQGFERLLTPDLFRSACQSFGSGASIPYPWDMFLDATYNHAVEDNVRFIMDISVAGEAALLDAVSSAASREGIPIGQVESRLRKSNLLHNIDRGLNDLLGRSFSVEYPTESEWIRRTWGARGLVAHGRPPAIHDGTQLREVTGEDRVQVIRSFYTLLVWLRDERLVLQRHGG